MSEILKNAASLPYANIIKNWRPEVAGGEPPTNAMFATAHVWCRNPGGPEALALAMRMRPNGASTADYKTAYSFDPRNQACGPANNKCTGKAGVVTQGYFSIVRLPQRSGKVEHIVMTAKGRDYAKAHGHDLGQLVQPVMSAAEKAQAKAARDTAKAAKAAVKAAKAAAKPVKPTVAETLATVDTPYCDAAAQAAADV